MSPVRWPLRTRRFGGVLAVVLVAAAVLVGAGLLVRAPSSASRTDIRAPSPPASLGTLPPSSLTSPSASPSRRMLAVPTVRQPQPQTSAPPPRPSTDGSPLSGKVIAIDPGHNPGNASHLAQINRQVFVGNGDKACNTVGTSTNSGYPEWRFTLAVALRLQTDLQALGAQVYLTHADQGANGYGPCVDARGRFGAQVHADLEISLHGDGTAASLHGFHVIAPGPIAGYPAPIAASHRLQLAVRSALHEQGFSYADYYGGHGLVTRTDLGTLNMATVPVVMVELGNMRNTSDAAVMTSVPGQARYAAALTAGISTYAG